MTNQNGYQFAINITGKEMDKIEFGGNVDDLMFVDNFCRLKVADIICRNLTENH